MARPKNFMGIILVAMVFVSASCRTREVPASQQKTLNLSLAQSMTGKITAKCGSCHPSDNGPNANAWFKDLAAKTAPIHQCMKEKNCYASSLAEAEVNACWNCLGAEGSDRHLGLYHSAVRQGVVKQLATQKKIPNETLERFNAMPLSDADPNKQIASEDIPVIADWLADEAAHDYPAINSLMPIRTGNEVVKFDSVTCDGFSPKVTSAIIDDYHRSDLTMYGCPGQGWPEDPNTCLQNLENTPYANALAGHIVKLVKANTGESAYWMRSSPDGRFSSTGNGKMHDFKVEGRVIQGRPGDIDPVYTPDGKFYSWPGVLCPMDRLYDLSTKQVGRFAPESKCVESKISMYQSFGLDPSGDALIIDSYNSNNSGSLARASDRRPESSVGEATIRRIDTTGADKKVDSIKYEGEGSIQLAPSGQLMVGQFVADGKTGYRVHAIRPNGTDVNLFDKNAVGHICIAGEKPNMSFDNRFVVFHHYMDNSPYDSGATANSVNVFIYDIKTRKSMRVTHMPYGTGAFFPHFRADGWLYFLVKKEKMESIVASNAAILLKAANP